MPMQRKAARVMKWRGSWYLMFTDHLTGKQRRLACEGLGARTPERRRELEREFRARELTDAADVMRHGGQLAFNAALMDGIERFEADLAERVRVREANPDARGGVAASTAKLMRDTLQRFRHWLGQRGKDQVTSGGLDGPTLKGFFDYLASERGLKGRSKVKRSAATINHHKRNLRACLGFINALRPKRFPDFDALLPALRPLRVNATTREAFSPDELRAFLDAAAEREQPDRVITVTRTKGGKVEQFSQPVSTAVQTPASRLFLLLALTGMRLGEALGLKWADVDLQRGRLVIRSQKTGLIRVLPLVGAPEGDVAPALVQLLRVWKLEAGDRDYLLPHGTLAAPVYPKGAWTGANSDADVKRIGPQMLRQNFTSYAASFGVPAAVCALWQGHSAAIAERHYRAQVLDRAPGRSIEEAMGLSGWIASRLPETVALAHRVS